jgi:uncharacterized membrane protein YiaA
MKKLWIRLSNVGVALYLILVLALVQALFSTSTYVEVASKNQEMAFYFRCLSVLFFSLGVLIVGWNCLEFSGTRKALWLAIFCASFCCAISIFAIRGFFMIIFACRLTPAEAASKNFFNCSDIVVYFATAFVLLLLVGYKKKLNSTRQP